MITGLEKVALEVSSRALRRHLASLNDVTTREDDPRVRDAHELIIRGLAQAQLFDVQNVTEWLNHMQHGMSMLETVEGLPYCLPPYPFTYLEWGADGGRCGALVACGGMHDEAEKVATIFAFDIAPAGLAYCNGTAHVRFTPEGTATFTRDDTGKIKGVLSVPSESVVRMVQSDPELEKSFYNTLSWTAVTALFAFSLMHCTNVRQVEVDPRSLMSRQQRRDMERRKKEPILYKVLEIKPLGSYRRGTTAAQGEGRTKRLHHVRGHFSEYGPEYGKGKLFGKYEGRFFIPPHIRGDLQEGTVAKTYKLGKPSGKEDLSRYGR